MSRTVSVLALGALLLCGSLWRQPGRPLSVSYSTAASPPLALGFLDHLERPYRASLRGAILDSAVSIGLTWSRQDVPWSYVEPSPPANGQHRYDWARIDGVVSATRAANLKVVATLGRPPAWAHTGTFEVTGQQQNGISAEIARSEDAAAYARATGTHLGASVDAWEIVNEPNSAASAAAYGQFLIAAAGALRSAAPHATILLGGLDPTETTQPDPQTGASKKLAWRPFVSELKRTGALQMIDAVNIHWFCSHDAHDFSRLARLLEAATDSTGKPVWITELGCAPGASQSDSALAAYIERALIVAAAQPGVVAIFFADGLWDGAEGGSDGPFNRTGLFSADGSPKPVVSLIRSFAGRLARFGRPVVIDSCVDCRDMRYRFARSGTTMTSRLMD